LHLDNRRIKMSHSRPKIYSAWTPADIAALSEEHGTPNVTAQLEKDEAKYPASKWTGRHLVAYRLLVNPALAADLLDVFDDDHKNCPLCHPGNPSPQQLHHGRTEALINECPRDLDMSRLGTLSRLLNGKFWAALAAAIRPYALEELAGGPRDHRRDKPDRVTKHLLDSFLLYTLACCLIQDAKDEDEEVQVRYEERKSRACINGVNITAWDDGGIYMVAYRGDGAG
jgi:hypothetical protein